MHERLAELDPVAAGKIEPGNIRRTVRALEVAELTGRRFSEFAVAWDSYPPERVRVAGVQAPREVLRGRIERRVRRMIQLGLLEEVDSLIARGRGRWLTSSQAIGYAEVARHLRGECSLEEAIAGTVKRTASLARRQMSWFRRDPRVRWFTAGEDGAEGVATEILEYLRG
jgi:tRNA dimethylallyltransferase